ncbi:uncharacterized protein LOC122611630 [Drosophila teissieri]|uniref:uncharacterized protein LOC122611630 n=1 Tax=Drosophila teissieri TaxID=7243 RepID=UPI001CBA3C62|nr:uncharacterized protein LOC122611630 [Drosophila teissieri]
MILKRNNGRPAAYRLYNKHLIMKGFRRRRTKAIELQECLNELLSKDGNLIHRIRMMSMHRTRSILAESIKLLRRRNRKHERNYLRDEHNDRKLKLLLKKLFDHKTHSLYLKKMLANLKIQINEHDCSNIAEILKSHLKVMRKLTKGNLKEAEECYNVARQLRYMSRSRSTRRKPKKSFEKSIWIFLNSLKTQKNVETTKIMNNNKKESYTVNKKRNLFDLGEDPNEKPRKKRIHKQRILRPKQLGAMNFDLMKDSNVVSQKKSTHNIASRLKVKVYPREKTQTYNTADRETTPYTDTDLKQADKEENQQGTWRKPPYTDSKILKGRVKKRMKNKKVSKLKKEFTLTNATIEDESLQKDQSEQIEKENHTKNDLTKFPKSSNLNNIQNFSTYEKLKSAYQVETLKPLGKSYVLNRKNKIGTSDESLAKNQKMTVSKYFDIKSKLNPVLSASEISQTNSFSVAKPKVYSSLKSLDSVTKDSAQLPMSSMATTIINRLFEEKPIASDEPKRFHKTMDATKMSANSFLATISKIKASDWISAVWNDLRGKYKEWSSYVKTPEDAHKLKEILKWRYIQNVQKVLYNHVKLLKIDSDGGRSETESRKSVMSSRAIRSSFRIPTNFVSLGVKRASSTDISTLRQTHDAFVRSQMDTLKSGAFDKDVEQMEHMIMGRQVPISAEEVEIFKKYKSDPQHYNVLILNFGKHISDEKYEELLPVLEKNFQFISEQLVALSRERRVQKMQAKIEMQRAEEEVASKISGESYTIDRTDLSEYLEKRRDWWAAYIAKQARTPTEMLLDEARYQKRMDQLAKKREEREQRRLQQQRIHKKRRSLSAQFRAPRQTHRQRQAMEDIKEKLEGRKSKCSLTSLCCRQCSRCGLIWIQKCSEDSDDSSAEHICQNVDV